MVIMIKEKQEHITKELYQFDSFDNFSADKRGSEA